MKVNTLRLNHLENPLGFMLPSLVFSWKVSLEDDAESKAVRQRSARLEVSENADFLGLLHDSGNSEVIDSIAYTPVPEIALKPRTRYYWRVTVQADDGSVASSLPAWFETGKIGEPFEALWITSSFTDVPALLRKTFKIEDSKKIASARLYSCAAGLYEAEINGVKIGNEFLAPFCNKYSSWMQVQTYDITKELSSGENFVGVLLGDGWYKGNFGFEGGAGKIFGDRTGFIGEIVIQFTDGTSSVVSSDLTWETSPSYITFSSIYDGEWQDARLYQENWSAKTKPEDSVGSANVKPELGPWSAVEQLDIDKALLKDRLSIPVIVKETLRPKAIITTPAGETVIDMGQNMVGWLEFVADLPEGEELLLQFGEVLQHGNFYRDNLREAKQEFRYISDGTPRLLRPHFTYYGFRFVKVAGWKGMPSIEDFKGCVVYSDMDRTGWLETSNGKVNQLISNALWGQKGNFLDVPTDCPQRDERMGWTGDAQVFCATATFQMDTYAFFRKYLYDMRCEQELSGGIVPVVVPNMIRSSSAILTSSAWADATTIIPWTSYLFSGDKSILREHYSGMKSYIETIRAQDDGSRLWKPDFSFGDWLAQDAPSPYAPIGGTDIQLISTAYYHYSTMLTARAAAVLGLQEDAETYFGLAAEIREGYRKEFISQRGRLAVDTQTGAVVTLFMELMSEEHRERVAKRLYELLKKNNFYLKTGFVGTPYLCRVLSANGYSDTAYKLLLNEKFPSWLYCVNLGATTIWERWNSVLADGLIGDTGMNSLNHYAYGSICEWMYRDMCGINPLPESPGFRKVRIAQKPNGRLRFAKAKFDSPVGVYETSWEILEDGKLSIKIVVPFGGEAEVLLPDSGRAAFTVVCGTHEFLYMPAREYRFIWTTSIATIGEMLDNEDVMAVIDSISLKVRSYCSSVIGMNMHSSTLREQLGKFGFPCDSDTLNRIDAELKEW